MSSQSLRISGLMLAIILVSSCASRGHRAEIDMDGSIAEYAARRNLADVRKALPEVVCDLRYGTKENVTHQILYPQGMPCLMNRSTLEKFRHAQELLHAQGFGLKIWDAWRPPEVQTELFRFGQKTDLFVNPAESWSFHCSGTAVDVTLVDSAGRELPMPTGFDESGPKARYDYQSRSAQVRRNIRALQDAMLQSGFSMVELEWWHFDDIDFKDDATRLPVVFAQEIGIKLPALH
ncbi:MAG: M15 family metallopeptidase [Verrucomicrobiaceae bacterium]